MYQTYCHTFGYSTLFVRCRVPQSEENAGKSTILEMLAMIPVFPRRRSCSTLLAIHLRLRRHPGMSRATLRVLPADGQETGEAGEVVCMDMPQENGWLMVQERGGL